jgi:predicted transcriptional regulator
MKQKISVQLPEELFAALEAAAEQRGTTRTAVVEAALQQFLSNGAEDAETDDDAALRRRLEWMSHQLEQLERDLRIVNETVALHARFDLTVTPPIPQPHQRAACLLGQERFDVFAAQVGRRVHLGTPLMRETMDRLTTTNPDLFTREVEEGAPLGAPSREAGHAAPAAGNRNREPHRSAAAGEGGSNGSFPGHRKVLSR